MRKCTVCQTRKPESDFSSNRNRCRSCARNNDLQRRYGISLAEYEKILESQGFTCAICHCEAAVFMVDHNHTTGEVRGLLCNSCNLAIGSFKDNTVLLHSAMMYLLK